MIPPYDLEGECEITSNSGFFSFTLTAIFEDGTKSPPSDPYFFNVGNWNPGNWNLAPIFNLLLKD